MQGSKRRPFKSIIPEFFFGCRKLEPKRCHDGRCTGSFSATRLKESLFNWTGSGSQKFKRCCQPPKLCSLSSLFKVPISSCSIRSFSDHDGRNQRIPKSRSDKIVTRGWGDCWAACSQSCLRHLELISIVAPLAWFHGLVWLEECSRVIFNYWLSFVIDCHYSCTGMFYIVLCY